MPKLYLTLSEQYDGHQLEEGFFVEYQTQEAPDTAIMAQVKLLKAALDSLNYDANFDNKAPIQWLEVK
jgi:hypothetical protein